VALRKAIGILRPPGTYGTPSSAAVCIRVGQGSGTAHVIVDVNGYFE
jgi:hypothetical protein